VADKCRLNLPSFHFFYYQCCLETTGSIGSVFFNGRSGAGGRLDAETMDIVHTPCFEEENRPDPNGAMSRQVNSSPQSWMLEDLSPVRTAVLAYRHRVYNKVEEKPIYHWTLPMTLNGCHCAARCLPWVIFVFVETPRGSGG